MAGLLRRESLGTSQGQAWVTAERGHTPLMSYLASEAGPTDMKTEGGSGVW